MLSYDLSSSLLLGKIMTTEIIVTEKPVPQNRDLKVFCYDVPLRKTLPGPLFPLPGIVFSCSEIELRF